MVRFSPKLTGLLSPDAWSLPDDNRIRQANFTAL